MPETFNDHNRRVPTSESVVEMYSHDRNGLITDCENISIELSRNEDSTGDVGQTR